MKIIFVFFIMACFVWSCTNYRINEANNMHQRWIEANDEYFVLDSIDNQIHQFNESGNSCLLWSALSRLESIPIDNRNINFESRRLSIMRLLHKYDTVASILSTYSDNDFGVFGKRKQVLFLEISECNYNHQYELKEQKINEIVAYMEYCFERHSAIENGVEIAYLQKYKGNPLASEAIATDVNDESLNLYLTARLLRGDCEKDIESIIIKYYQTNVINNITQKLLLGLLDGDYVDKDFDMLL